MPEVVGNRDIYTHLFESRNRSFGSVIVHRNGVENIFIHLALMHARGSHWEDLAP